jgi:hypothetical protein
MNLVVIYKYISYLFYLNNFKIRKSNIVDKIGFEPTLNIQQFVLQMRMRFRIVPSFNSPLRLPVSPLITWTYIRY